MGNAASHFLVPRGQAFDKARCKSERLLLSGSALLPGTVLQLNPPTQVAFGASYSKHLLYSASSARASLTRTRLGPRTSRHLVALPGRRRHAL
jgi:hypothetical protein